MCPFLEVVLDTDWFSEASRKSVLSLPLNTKKHSGCLSLIPPDTVDVLLCPGPTDRTRELNGGTSFPLRSRGPFLPHSPPPRVQRANNLLAGEEQKHSGDHGDRRVDHRPFPPGLAEIARAPLFSPKFLQRYSHKSRKTNRGLDLWVWQPNPHENGHFLRRCPRTFVPFCMVGCFFLPRISPSFGAAPPPPRF